MEIIAKKGEGFLSFRLVEMFIDCDGHTVLWAILNINIYTLNKCELYLNEIVTRKRSEHELTENRKRKEREKWRTEFNLLYGDTQLYFLFSEENPTNS